MYIKSYKSFRNENNSLEIEHIKQTYDRQRKEINDKYLLIFKTFKAMNDAIAGKFKDIHNQYFACLSSDELRQNLVGEHCNHCSVTLAQHNLYHENSTQLKEQILNYFSKYKTFLNELAIFLCRTELASMRGVRSKSFGSLLESVKENISDNNAILLLKKHGQYFEDVLFFRDKYIEHPKRTYDFYIATQPFEGSILIPAIVTEKESTQEELFRNEILEMNEDLDMKLELSTIGIESENLFNYYYHVIDINQSYIQNTRLVIDEYTLPIFKIFDNTKTHFIKYGIHYHCFPDPELDGLVNQVFVDSSNQKSNASMINYKSPSYFDCQKHLYSFLIALLIKNKT